jgi:hypothetical protein
VSNNRNSSAAIYYAMNWPLHNEQENKDNPSNIHPFICACSTQCDCANPSNVNKSTDDKTHNPAVPQRNQPHPSAESQKLGTDGANKSSATAPVSVRGGSYNCKEPCNCTSQAQHCIKLEKLIYKPNKTSQNAPQHLKSAVEAEESKVKQPAKANEPPGAKLASPAKSSAKAVGYKIDNKHDEEASIEKSDIIREAILSSAAQQPNFSHHKKTNPNVFDPRTDHEKEAERIAKNVEIEEKRRAAREAEAEARRFANASIIADEKFYEKTNLKQVERRLKIDAFHRRYEDNRRKQFYAQENSRERPATAVAAELGRPAFTNYGAGNVNPTSGGMIYGQYLLSHNVKPDIKPNSPAQSQSYFTARFAADKRRKENLEAVKRLANAENLDYSAAFGPSSARGLIGTGELRISSRARARARGAAQQTARDAEQQHKKLITGHIHYGEEEKVNEEEAAVRAVQPANRGYKPADLDSYGVDATEAEQQLQWPADYGVEERKYGAEAATEYNTTFGPKTDFLRPQLDKTTREVSPSPLKNEQKVFRANISVQ